MAMGFSDKKMAARMLVWCPFQRKRQTIKRVGKV